MTDDKIITLKLPDIHVGQILDGLEARREAWERTVIYFQDGVVDGEIEEATDEDEAQGIADLYSKIIASIETQRKAETERLLKRPSSLEEATGYGFDGKEDIE